MAETETETETELPEDVIVNILCWLPVISLIRFTSVSKRFRSIILSDPKFATSQFEAARHRKTLRRRLLLFSRDFPQLESLDLDTTPFGVRQLSFPLEQLPRTEGTFNLMGSCNGLVVLVFEKFSCYIWNPTTRLLMELPNPGFSDGTELGYSGVGYVSAANDYKVFAASIEVENDDMTEEIKMFSSRAHVWKTIQPGHNGFGFSQGALINEALHWLDRDKNEIFAFDLAQEEFRTVRAPNSGVKFENVGVSEGCLCVFGFMYWACGSADFWVMREYGVYESWTKLFNFSYLPEQHPSDVYRDFIVMEGFTVAAKRGGTTVNNGMYVMVMDDWLLVKIAHKEEKVVGMYKTGTYPMVFPYQESLLWIHVSS